MSRAGGWFRSPDGRGSMHLSFSSIKHLPHKCAAPCLPGDNLELFGGHCGRIAAHLCDWPKDRGGGTCDAAMCQQHRTNVGPDRDVCPRHSNAAQGQELELDA